MRLWTQEPPQVGTALARRTRRDKLQISLAHWRRVVTAGYSDAYRATGSRPRLLILDSGGRDSLQKMRFEVVRILRRKEFDRTCE